MFCKSGPWNNIYVYSSLGQKYKYKHSYKKTQTVYKVKDDKHTHLTNT